MTERINRVAKPEREDGCWALIESRKRNCLRKAREGRLTCRLHALRERDAQAAKKEIEK